MHQKRERGGERLEALNPEDLARLTNAFVIFSDFVALACYSGAKHRLPTCEVHRGEAQGQRGREQEVVERICFYFNMF